MGATYQTICLQCGYEAMVSGGDDVGMNSLTTTILCENCQELCDIVTSLEPWNDHGKEIRTELVCPGLGLDDKKLKDIEPVPNPSHKVHKWVFPGPCPRCGTTMTRRGDMICWD
jgi:hypothetical protein